MSNEFEDLDQKELAELFNHLKKLEKELEGEIPSSKEDLWAWIKKETGFNIPRNSVCPNHDAPMDFMWDIFSGKVENALVIAARGTAKTQNLAVLQYANSIFKPGLSGLTAAATDVQAKRCYNYITPWLTVTQHGKTKNKDYVAQTNIDKTSFTHGGSIENLPATVKSLNGPHTQFTHADEVEIWDDEQAWKEFQNIPASKQWFDPQTGKKITYDAQVVLTSTRKFAGGRIQNILDKVEQAKKDEVDPPYRVYFWCVFEAAQRQPNCREAAENKGRPEEELCACHGKSSGRWADKSPRRFSQVCGGKLYRSDGFRPIKEIYNTFKSNDQETWEAQQECKRPSSNSNYIKNWDLSIHGLKEFLPDPDNGPIHMGVDWGSTNPSAVTWTQLIKKPVKAINWNDQEITLQENTFVVFDEIYRSDVGATELANLVVAREQSWSMRLGKPFEVKGRYSDPQGKMQRYDFLNAGLETSWFTDRNFDSSVTRIREIFKEDGTIYVVQPRVPMFCEEVAVWHMDEKGRQVDVFNHSIDSVRYCLGNMFLVEMIDLSNRQYKTDGDFQRDMTSGRVRPRNRGKIYGPIGYDSTPNPLDNYRPVLPEW